MKHDMWNKTKMGRERERDERNEESSEKWNKVIEHLQRHTANAILVLYVRQIYARGNFRAAKREKLKQ